MIILHFLVIIKKSIIFFFSNDIVIKHNYREIEEVENIIKKYLDDYPHYPGSKILKICLYEITQDIINPISFDRIFDQLEKHLTNFEVLF